VCESERRSPARSSYCTSVISYIYVYIWSSVAHTWENADLFKGDRSIDFRKRYKMQFLERVHMFKALNFLKLTPWNTVRFHKVTVILLIKKFPVWYGTQTSITVFVRASHWSLSWASQTECTHFFLKIHLNNINLSPTPRSSKQTISFVFPDQNFVYILLPHTWCMSIPSHCPRLTLFLYVMNTENYEQKFFLIYIYQIS
jgi:hypothetical protein